MDQITKKRTIKVPWLGASAFILAGAAVVAFFLYNIFVVSHPAQAQIGILDLSGWNRQDIVPLSGNWEFYPFHFVQQTDTKKYPSSFIAVPSVWNGQETDGAKMPGFGYASYRLRITGLKPGESIAMRISPMSTAYEFYVDGKEAASCGRAGTSAGQSVPYYNVRVIHCTAQGPSMDLVAHVSNYVYDRGGMWFTPSLGTPEAIDGQDAATEHRDWFVLGAIMIIAFSAVMTAVLRNDWREIPFFLILCLSVAVRITLTGSYIIDLIPFGSSLNVNVRLEYLTLIWIPTGYMLLSHRQFPELFRRWPVKAACMYSGIATLLILVLPIVAFVQIKLIAEVYIFVNYTYALSKLFPAFFCGDRNALPVLIGTFLFGNGIVYDFLLQNCYIGLSSVEIGPVGFLVFLGCEAFLIARQYADAVAEKELAMEKVLVLQQEASAAELKFLKSQIRPHFINNALNAIISILRTDAGEARKLLVEFSKYLRGCYDFNNLEDTVPIENELSFVRSYVALEKARFRDKLNVEYRVDDVSLLIPPLVLEPLVENAIIHGIRNKPEGGGVLVYILDCGDAVKIGVKDDGVGIAPDRVAGLLSGSSGARGVGIFNINQRLNKLYGISLSIENAEDGGADISMLIPKEKEDL